MHSATTYPFVSVVMPCGDESDFIKKSLGSLIATEYPKEILEIIIVVDKYSNDGTKEILKEIASSNTVVKILENEKRAVPFAMNIGIGEARGDIIVRVDAHGEYPSDYIEKCVEYLEKTGAWCVGGPFYNKPAENTFMAKAICAVLSSPFMLGSAHIPDFAPPTGTPSEQNLYVMALARPAISSVVMSGSILMPPPAPLPNVVQSITMTPFNPVTGS